MINLRFEGEELFEILRMMEQEIFEHVMGYREYRVSGKSKLDRPSIIFRGFSIPTYLIFDGDFKQKGKSDEKKTAALNHKFLRLSGVKEEDFPDTQVHDTWAVFKDNIESAVLHNSSMSSSQRIKVAASPSAIHAKEQSMGTAAH